MRARILLPTLVLLAACGQTGPLYLPDEGIDSEIEIRPAPATPPPSAEAGAEAAEDEEAPQATEK